MMKIGYQNTLLTRKVLLQNPEHLRQQGMLTIMNIAYIGKVSLPYLLSRRQIRSQNKKAMSGKIGKSHSLDSVLSLKGIHK